MKSNIRKLRLERNLSQTELAKVIGKTQQTISHMENDRERIPIDSLIALSNFFGVSTDYILGISSEENSNAKNKKLNSEIDRLAGEVRNIDPAGGNKKILYQLILSLLLCSLDDDTTQPSADAVKT